MKEKKKTRLVRSDEIPDYFLEAINDVAERLIPLFLSEIKKHPQKLWTPTMSRVHAALLVNIYGDKIPHVIVEETIAFLSNVQDIYQSNDLSDEERP